VQATSTPPEGRWPPRAAYLAAAVFLGASGAINLTYGWAKGSDIPSSLTWAAVSVAVAITFALTWPALIRSVDAKRWSAALVALAALVLAGGYSITAALGSAAGSRYNAASVEQSATETPKRAQAAYDDSRAALADLRRSRGRPRDR
jgi:drug/metabolite transporter (DMT)-like permease